MKIREKLIEIQTLLDESELNNRKAVLDTMLILDKENEIVGEDFVLFREILRRLLNSFINQQ